MNQATEEGFDERLNLRVPKGFNERLNKYIPSGIKSEVIRIVLEGLLADFEERGRSVIGEILDNKYKIRIGDSGQIALHKRSE